MTSTEKAWLIVVVLGIVSIFSTIVFSTTYHELSKTERCIKMAEQGISCVLKAQTSPVVVQEAKND